MFSFSAEIPDITSVFAREAAQHLHDGDIHRALELCTRGTAAFPKYATGYFVFGKCYEELGQTDEASVQYRRALTILPDNIELGLLVKHAEEKVEEKKLEQRRSQEEGGIENIAKRLKDLKRIQPVPAPETEPVPIHIGNEKRFVTATMAEIYASQGAYEESIGAYREVMKQHPEEKERFENRIRELEEMRTRQHPEKKLEVLNNKKAS